MTDATTKLFQERAARGHEPELAKAVGDEYTNEPADASTLARAMASIRRAR